MHRASDSPGDRWWAMLGLIISFAVLVLFGCGVLLWHFPLLIIAIAGGIAISIFAFGLQARRIRRIAAARAGESICTFARSFDCRVVDTWIIRAVYEELRHFVEFPVRASDRFRRDLGLDPDDIAEEVAERAGRSFDGAERNPFYDRVETVADLVGFFAHQPRSEQPTALRPH